MCFNSLARLFVIVFNESEAFCSLLSAGVFLAFIRAMRPERLQAEKAPDVICFSPHCRYRLDYSDYYGTECSFNIFLGGNVVV